MADVKNALHYTFGFIGGGNMAKAIAQGMVSQRLSSYSKMFVSVVRDESLECWRQLGVNATTCNSKVVEEADIIFIAVKPHVLPEAISQMYENQSSGATGHKLFISILAGVTLSTLEQILSNFEGSRVIRAMPNTPLAVGEGSVVYCPGQKATDADTAIVQRIFSSCGLCKLVPESMINAVSALTGSGPAYIYLVIESLADGAVKMGVPRELAVKFAAQTVFGAGKMVLETQKHPGVLKDEVCSPGGTTIAGIHALEKAGVRSAIMDAVEAACKRCEELGQKK